MALKLVAHQYELLKIPNLEFYYLINHTRKWSNQARPMPDNLHWVPYYEKGKYDLALLHIDQQCLLDPPLGKRRLFEQMKQVVMEAGDVPIIVINHGTTCYPEMFSTMRQREIAVERGIDLDDIESRQKVDSISVTVKEGEEWAKEKMKKMMEGVSIMVVNSRQAEKEWGFGKAIIHGLDPKEWWSLPKEPRVTTFISPGGMGNKYYGRFLYGNTRSELRERYGIEHVWIVEERPISGWDDYRDFLGRSLVYFNPTYGSPMPRSRTEAMMCLKPNSKVIMANDFSYKKIKDVKVGDIVINEKGKKVKIIQTHRKEYSDNFYKLSIYGHQPIESSGEHKFLAIRTSKFKYSNGAICRPDTRERDKYIKKDFNRLKPEWIEAHEIQKGDCILSPEKFEVDNYNFIKISDYVESKKVVKRDGYIRWKGCLNNLPEACREQGNSYSYIKKCLRENRYPGEKSKKFLSYLQNGGYKDIGFYEDNFKITPEFSRFIGYYIAEGYTQKSTVRLCFNSNETEYHNDIVSLVKDVFNLNAKTIERDNNRTEVVFNNYLIAKFLENICGQGAKNKIIPKELVNSNDNRIIVNLLAGLYRGDGHIGNETDYCSISSRLIYQIYFLLKRLGVHGTITSGEAYRYGKKCADTYHVRSYGTYKDVVRSIVDDLKIVDKKHKGHSYFNYQGNWYYIVSGIEKFKYNGMVYDLTVEGHNYLVNGLITHNSGCCIVTTKYHDIANYIRDGVNGFIIRDDPEDAAERINWCINNYGKAVKIGEKGRKTAIKEFNYKRFQNEWRDLIEEVLSGGQRNEKSKKSPS